jgi:hypothetical protein
MFPEEAPPLAAEQARAWMSNSINCWRRFRPPLALTTKPN